MKSACEAFILPHLGYKLGVGIETCIMSSADSIFGTVDRDEVVHILVSEGKIPARARSISFADMSAAQQHDVRTRLAGVFEHPSAIHSHCDICDRVTRGQETCSPLPGGDIRLRGL